MSARMGGIYFQGVYKMKNLVKLVGIIALVAVIGFFMAACDDGENTDPKNLVITGLSGKTGEVGMVIMNNSWEWIAAGQGTISGDSVTIELWDEKDNKGERWTGSGSYYVAPRLLTEDIIYKYTDGTNDWVKVNFTGTTTTLAFNKFIVQ
jgi:hypothetical protein